MKGQKSKHTRKAHLGQYIKFKREQLNLDCGFIASALGMSIKKYTQLEQEREVEVVMLSDNQISTLVHTLEMEEAEFFSFLFKEKIIH